MLKVPLSLIVPPGTNFFCRIFTSTMDSPTPTANTAPGNKMVTLSDPTFLANVAQVYKTTPDELLSWNPNLKASLMAKAGKYKEKVEDQVIPPGTKMFVYKVN